MRVLRQTMFVLAVVAVTTTAASAQRQQVRRQADVAIAGSGATGVFAAIRLAERLRKSGQKAKIVLFDAGGDVANRIPLKHAQSADPNHPQSRGMNLDYPVQYLHDEVENGTRFNFRRDKGGDLHTRGKGRGGSANHHALFNLKPPKSYWNAFAQEVGDSSWSADEMAKHEAVVDEMLPLVRTGLRNSRSLGDAQGHDARDPNDDAVRASFKAGLLRVPVNTKKMLRWGPRELLNAYLKANPGSIELVEHTLVDRAVFDTSGRVTAVKVIRGGRLGADHDGPLPETEETFEIGKAFVDSTGAFEAPGTMWRSGLGPEEKLRRLGITRVVSNVPAGEGLGARMETGVIGKLNPFKVGKLLVMAGPSQNGATHLDARIAGEGPEADGVRIGLAGGAFKGYNWGYTDGIIQPGVVTILDLQAKTNHFGFVEPQSADPRVRPKINFNMFDPKYDPEGKDLRSAISGFRQALAAARKMGVSKVYDHASDKFVRIEHFEGMNDTALGGHIRRVVWDHHPSGTTRMGRADEASTVVLPNFVAKGTENYYSAGHQLFRNPIGVFPVQGLYAVGVKAADTLYDRYFSTPQNP